MLNPFCAAFLLSLEAQKVMELRLVRIAWGGADARSEMMSMVGEKVVAAMEAADGRDAWREAAARMKGLAASFGAVRLMALAAQAADLPHDGAMLAKLRRSVARL